MERLKVGDSREERRTFCEGVVVQFQPRKVFVAGLEADALIQTFHELGVPANGIANHALETTGLLITVDASSEASFVEMRESAGELAPLRQRVAAAEAKATEERRLRALAEARLNEITQSAGWRSIQRYRTWLNRQRRKHPALFRRYESVASRLLTPNTPELRTETAPLHPTERASDPAYQRWIDENEPFSQALLQQREKAARIAQPPLLSIVLPVYQVAPEKLQQCVESVCRQTYGHWELCIADGNPESPTNRTYLREVAARDPRVQVQFLEKNLGISGNSNAALEASKGEFVVFLDHDDTLAPFALFELATAFESTPSTDFLYSDHDYIDERHIRFGPLFKPDWSPEVLYSANYVTHLTAIRRELVEQVGRFDPITDGAQDWDLFFKVLERTTHVQHIPKILYHWRVHSESSALNSAAKPYTQSVQIDVIQRHLDRTGARATVERLPNELLHLRWTVAEPPLVSIVMPSNNSHGLLPDTVEGLCKQTRFAHWELFIVVAGEVNASTDKFLQTVVLDTRIRIIRTEAPFNYSAANNLAARQAQGELLLFLNDDISITEPGWLDELVGWAQQRQIGAVGAKLLHRDGTIQHAGVVVGLEGFAGHPFAGRPPLSWSLFGNSDWYRNYSAVTGACMMMRREVFEQIGGFDETFLLCGSDVEICLRARRYGYRVLYNPFAELIHYERSSRGDREERGDFDRSLTAYREYLEQGDPYWNPNLSLWNPAIAFRYQHEQSSLAFAKKHLHIEDSHEDEEERRLIESFDFSQSEVNRSRQEGRSIAVLPAVRSVLWMIPAFEHAHYGGIHTVLRFALDWGKTFNVKSRFAVCGTTDAQDIAARIRMIYPECSNSDVIPLVTAEEASSLPAADAVIATLWTTAYYALKHRRSSRKFYLVQDDEPAFFRAGSASALAENTYRFGFLGIANTISLGLMYTNEYGGRATHFDPSIDPTIFHARGRHTQTPTQRQVFFYGRPNHPRNAFTLAAGALRLLKAKWGQRLRIVSAGAAWNPAAHSLDGIVENLGLLAYSETAQLYRECDAGLVLMMTRHPSYIPLELMACGTLVVSSRNQWTEWLLHHEQNCLLSESSATSLADTIDRGLIDDTMRLRLTQNASADIERNYRDWANASEKVYRFLCNPSASEH